MAASSPRKHWLSPEAAPISCRKLNLKGSQAKGGGFPREVGVSATKKLECGTFPSIFHCSGFFGSFPHPGFLVGRALGPLAVHLHTQQKAKDEKTSASERTVAVANGTAIADVGGASRQYVAQGLCTLQWPKQCM